MTPNPQQAYLLDAIGREPGITTMTLKADLELSIRLGITGLDESRLIRDLGELAREGEIRQDVGWWPVEKVKEVKARQQELMF